MAHDILLPFENALIGAVESVFFFFVTFFFDGSMFLNADMVLTHALHFSSYFWLKLFFGVRSQEGSQFCKGFGGIGGILRWRVDFAEMDESNYEDQEDWGEGF